MLGLWERDSQETLEAEILLYKLQGQRLAKADGVQGETCIYCGALPRDRDHVLPFSYKKRNLKHISRRNSLSEGPVVQACHQCNIMLGKRIFTTFRNRLEFLFSRYKTLEEKTHEPSYLWGEDEVEELGENLKHYVKSQIIKDLSIKSSIWWLERLLSAER